MEKPEPAPPSPLEAALHAQVNAIASRPIDPRMLLELEQTCRLTRELLAIGKMPDAFRKQHLIPGDPLSLYESGVGSGVTVGPMGSYASPGFAGLAAPSNPTETFGVQAIKELIALVPGLMAKPAAAPAPEPQMSYADMASAMAVAKGAGDDKLYDQLFRLLELEQERGEISNAQLRDGEASPDPEPIETHAEEKTEAA